MVHAVATGWLLLGVTLALIIGLEITYRAQGAVRREFRSEVASRRRSLLHPNRATDWWANYRAGARWTAGFDPYRGTWPDSVTGRYVNIDALGRRATFDPTPDSEDVTHVWMFGGSAMWGHLVRDRYTIPSLLADELHLRGVDGVRIHNLAQSTFNLTQEVSTLLLELRAGRSPDLVVFMDGNNEVAPPFQSGRVGTILNQDRLAERLRSPSPGILDLITRNLQLAQRLSRVARPPIPLGDPTLCPEIASQYANLTDVVRALGSSYDFATRFYWQPMLAISGKPRTEWEDLIPEKAEWRALVRACTAAVDDSISARGYGDYRTLSDLFDDETGSVFIDDYGHVTEAANRVVAKAIADDLMPILIGR